MSLFEDDQDNYLASLATSAGTPSASAGGELVVMEEPAAGSRVSGGQSFGHSGGSLSSFSVLTKSESNETDSRKLGVVVIDPASPKVPCLAVLFSGDTACSTINCRKVGHDTKTKATMPAGPVLAIKANRTSIFVEPLLATENLPADWVENTLSEHKTLDEWRTTFIAAKTSIARGSGQGDEIADYEQSLRSSDPKTPNPKLKFGQSLASAFGSFTIDDYVTPFGEDQSVTLARLGSDPSLVNASVAGLDIAMGKVFSYVGSLQNGLSAMEEQTHKSLEQVLLNFQKLGLEMGETTGRAGLSSTVWSSIDNVAALVGNEEPEVSVTADLKALNDTVEKLGNRVTTLEVERDTLKAELKAEREAVTSDLKSHLAKTKELTNKTFAGILSRLDALEKAKLVGAPSGGGLTAGQIATIVDERIKVLTEQMSNLDSKIKLLQSRKDAKVAQFGNTGIGTVKESVMWIKEHNPDGEVGCNLDFPLFCLLVEGTQQADFNSYLVNAEKRSKLNMSSDLHGQAIYSMHLNKPHIFMKGEPDTKPHSSFCPALKDYSKWIAPDNGLRDRMLDKIDTVPATFSDRSNIALAGRDKAQALASKMVSATVSFVRGWISFSEQTFSDLTNKTKFSEKTAFSLLTMIWARIIRDIFSCRESLASSLESGKDERSSLTNSGICLLGVLKTHDIMQEYIVHRFKDHPSVSAEYIKFLATNTAYERVATLEDTVKKLEKGGNGGGGAGKASVDKAHTAIAKINDKLKELETALDGKKDK